MTEEMSFDFDGDSGSLDIIEIPVKIDGKRYLMREASEEASRRYRNALAHCSKMGLEGNLESITGPIADVDSLLLSLCMFSELADGTGYKDIPIGIALVRLWPARVTKPLYKRLREISDLDDEDKESLQKQMIEIQKKLQKMSAEELAKNELKPTEDTSS